MNDWAKALAPYLKRDARVLTLPSWLVTMLGIFVPAMGELKEMRYQWEEPYRVDDAKYRTTLGVSATPFEEQCGRPQRGYSPRGDQAERSSA